MGDSLKAAKELKARMLSVWQTVKGLRKEYSHPAIKNKAAFGVQVTPEEDRTARWADNLRNRGPLLSKRNAYDLLARPIGWGMQQGATIGLAALSKVKSALVSVGRYAGFAAMAGLGISLYQLEQHTVNVAHNAVAYDQFAVSVGSATKATIDLIQAYKVLGIESATVMKGIQTVQDLVLEGRLRDRSSVALLKDLGMESFITGDKLPSGVAMFDMISASIMDAKSNIEQLSLAYRVFGDDAAKILKIATLSRIDPKGAHKDLGMELTPQTIAEYYKAQNMALQISARIDASMAKVLTVLGPIILQGLDFVDRGLAALNQGNTIDTVVKWVFTQISIIVDFLANLPTYIKSAGAEMQLIFAKLIAQLTDIRYILESYGGWLTGDFATAGAAKKMVGNNQATKDMQAAQDKAWILRAQVRNPTTYGISQLAMVQNAVANKGVNDYYSKMVGLLRLYTPLLAKAKEYSKASTLPVEAFKTSMRELAFMRESKMLDPAAFGRTFMRLVGDAEKNMNAIDIRLPSAASRDSVEARSAVVRSEVEYNLTNANTPIERMRRVIEIGNGYLSIIEANTRRTAEEISNNPDMLRLP